MDRKRYASNGRELFEVDIMRTNFKMEDKYIKMIRGDTLSFGIQIMEDNEGKPLSQDLDFAHFVCKSNNYINRYIFDKTLNDGITKVGQGEYVVRVDPRDTKYAKAGKYLYELEIGLNGDVFTVMQGVLELQQDVRY